MAGVVSRSWEGEGEGDLDGRGAVLGRRGALACSGGGRSGADGERNNIRGWTVFETPSTPGSLGAVGSDTSVPDQALTTVSNCS